MAEPANNPAPAVEAAPAPAGALLSARVVDPNNPRTQEEDSECKYQWAAETNCTHPTIMDYMAKNFTFTCKDANGFWWFRKEMNLNSRNTSNPRTIGEDKEHMFQWSDGAGGIKQVEDGWNFCGADSGGQKWYRRQWPRKDPMHPLRVEDDTELRYEWSVLADTGDTLALIREGWEYTGQNRSSTRLAGNWRRKRLVPGILPPGAPEPGTPQAVEELQAAAAAKRARRS